MVIFPCVSLEPFFTHSMTQTLITMDTSPGIPSLPGFLVSPTNRDTGKRSKYSRRGRPVVYSHSLPSHCSVSGSVPLLQGFLTAALVTFGAIEFFVAGSVPCIVEYLMTFLACIFYIPIVIPSPPCLDSQKCLQVLPMSPGDKIGCGWVFWAVAWDTPPSTVPALTKL